MNRKCWPAWTIGERKKEKGKRKKSPHFFLLPPFDFLFPFSFFLFPCLLVCWTLGVLPGVLAGEEPPARLSRDRGPWRRAAPNGKNEPAVRVAFQEALKTASAATVRILADGEEVALGAIVEPDGYLVSKASLLSGKLTCRFKDGTEKEARILGEDARHDLALLRVEAANLPTIAWREGAPPLSGSLVATTGPASQPLGIGVVSAELRRIRGPVESPRPRAWLGIDLGAGRAGCTVTRIMPNSPAEKAGLLAGDEIRQIDAVAMESADQIVRTIGGHVAGQTVKLLVHRKEEDVKALAKLAKPQPLRAPQDEWGGGPFSERRSGFPLVLPHDTPLNPGDCGGPLVDTDGRTVGINIARALRVTTYALPASVVREVVSQLKQESKSAAKGQ
jgi:serine protease Do